MTSPTALSTFNKARSDLQGPHIEEIDSGMCERCGKGAYLSNDICGPCTAREVASIQALMDDGTQDPSLAEPDDDPCVHCLRMFDGCKCKMFHAQPVPGCAECEKEYTPIIEEKRDLPVVPLRELPKPTEGLDISQMLNAEEIKSRTKLFASRHAEFVRWYGMTVNNEDMDKDELQAKQWLTERILRSPTEESEDWKLVMEMYEESRMKFREKVRADLEKINAGVYATMDVKKVYQSVCFNGFVYWTIVIPEDWFTQLKNGRKNKIGDHVIKYYDCRKIAIDPHKDETVQMNPELSTVQDKAFLELFVQYENMLSKQMHFINGPATEQMSFYNGRLEEPMYPTVVSKLSNIKKLAEDAKLDNAMCKVCLQFIPKVMIVEFVPNSEGMGKKVMEDRGYHMQAMTRLTKYCRQQGIKLGQSTARAPPQ